MYYLRFKDLFTKDPIPAGRLLAGGEAKVVVRNEMEQIIYESDWIKNTILDQGLVQISTDTSSDSHWYLGDSGVATSFTQVGLQGNQLALSTSSGVFPQVFTNSQSPDYIYSTTYNKRFTSFTGTIRELVICHTNSPTTAAVIRVVIAPEIVVTSGQIVDVFYKYSVYHDLTDNTGTVDIAGETYNWTSRIGDVDQTNGNTSTIEPVRGNLGSFSYHYAYDGQYTALGAITASVPVGSGSNQSVTQVYGEGGGSGYADWRVYMSTTKCNFGTGIRFLRSSMYTQNYQFFQFSRQSDGETIQKDQDKTLSITCRMVWGRH